MYSSGGNRAVHNIMFFFFFPSFLAFQFEVHNPGYSHYKSCLLDLRPQTGDRLCNLVSFSILLGFMGRCLTLQAGYLLATLKATFFFLLTSHAHTTCACVQTCKKREKKKCVLHSVKALQVTSALLFPQGSHVLYFLKHRFSSSINPWPCQFTRPLLSSHSLCPSSIVYWYSCTSMSGGRGWPTWSIITKSSKSQWL